VVFKYLGFVGEDPDFIKGVDRDIGGAELFLGFGVYSAPEFFA